MIKNRKKIISIFFGLLICNSNVAITNRSILPETEAAKNLEMYQILKDCHELFEQYDLTYWAAAGTLLGAIRHKGLIPWDNDLDIFISQNDEEKLVALAKPLEILGYTLYKKRDFVYMVISTKIPTIHMDIIFTYQNGNNIFYSCRILQQRFRRNNLPLYFTQEELFPLQLSTFGLFKTIIPASPIPYLQAAYGKDCMTHARTGQIVQKLQENDFRPGLPLGPLKNNFTKN